MPTWDELADDVDRLGPPVVAGFSTHCHWDHLLWHPRFGDVPRYATAANAQTAAGGVRERAQAMAADCAPGIPLELIGLLTPLPEDGGLVPGTIIEHEAHAIGHAALLLADRGVLVAGDMLSDVLIPCSTLGAPDQVAAYASALDRLGEAAEQADIVVPGHGAVAEGGAWRPACPPIGPTSTPWREEWSRSTRGSSRTGSRVPTRRTWSRPEPVPG